MVTNETQEQLEARGWDFTEEFIPDEPTVNNQDKTVDVSENGTIEVTPDEGFTGLGKVTVNTNIESGGSNWRYFDTTKATVTEDSLVVIAMLFQAFKNNYGDNLITILPKYPPLEEWGAKIVVAVATDFNLKIFNPALTGFESLKTIEEVFNTLGGVEALEEALGFTEITEAEFYDLNA